MDSTYSDPYSSTPPPTAADTAIANAIMGIYAIVIVLVIVCNWRIFSKAGKPGWAAIVPVYNTIVMLQVAERPWWWIFLYLIPFVGLIFGYIVLFDFGKVFGKSTGWSILWMCVFPVIGLPMLAFGSATYTGRGSGGAGPVPPAPLPSAGIPA